MTASVRAGTGKGTETGTGTETGAGTGAASTPPPPAPPAGSPPAHALTTQTPPAQPLPVQTPPVQTPPVQTPAIQTPAIQTPPVQTPPVHTVTDQSFSAKSQPADTLPTHARAKPALPVRPRPAQPRPAQPPVDRPPPAQPPPAASARSLAARALALAAPALVWLSFLLVSLEIWRNVRDGGHPWKQGDWLINDLGVAVRRGPFGSAALALADAIGASPLVVVGACQIGLLLVLYLAFWRLIAGLKAPGLALVLAASPAMFTMFWVADPTGAGRKELIAFAALALCALAAVRRRRGAFLAGSALLWIGFVAHEATVLFLPFHLALAWAFARAGGGAAFAGALAAATALAAAGGVGLALAHPLVPDPAVVCRPLLERGLAPRICEGAIDWLGGKRSFSLAAIPGGAGAFAGFAAAAAASLAAPLYLASLTARPRLAALAVLAAALPFLPLFYLGVDWGRWVSLQATAATILAAALIRLGALRLVRPVDPRAALILAALGLALSPAHMIGAMPGGALRAAAGLLAD